MEITIKGEPKEIAVLVLEIQGRHTSKNYEPERITNISKLEQLQFAEELSKLIVKCQI